MKLAPWETSAGTSEHGRVWWSVVEAGGGDMVADMGEGPESERLANMVAALPALILALAGVLEELDRREPYSVTDPLIARRRAARAALQKAGVTP